MSDTDKIEDGVGRQQLFEYIQQQISERFDRISEGLVEMSGRLVEMSGRLVEMSGKLDRMSGRLVEMSGGLDRMSEEFSTTIQTLDQRLQEVGNRMSQSRFSTGAFVLPVRRNGYATDLRAPTGGGFGERRGDWRVPSPIAQ